MHRHYHPDHAADCECACCEIVYDASEERELFMGVPPCALAAAPELTLAVLQLALDKTAETADIRRDEQQQ